MSDPMSSVEIEDVLSSIRRLVSEDLRPSGRQVPSQPRRPAEPAAAEKLILTPSLRVVTDTESATRSMDEATVRDLSEKLDVAEAMAAYDASDWCSVDWQGTEAEIIALHPQAAEPGWAQQDPGAGTGDSSWIDQAEADVIATLAETVTARTGALHLGWREDDAADDGRPSPPQEQAQFDEEVLRELVRDIIHEELQGGLGERMTRNVRKLVRAEIARALAAQDFD